MTLPGAQALLYTLILMMLPSAGMGAKDVYVAANGDASWPGTRTKPVATLAKARDISRQSKPGEKKRIIVRAGRYALTESVLFDARDSGLTIEAAPGEEAIIYGGRRITGWQRDRVVRSTS